MGLGDALLRAVEHAFFGDGTARSLHCFPPPALVHCLAGRLELHIELGAPDAATREAVLSQRLGSLALGAGVSGRVLAADTAGWSVAQVSRLCDAAAMAALQEAMAGGGSPHAMSPLLADMLGLPLIVVAADTPHAAGDFHGDSAAFLSSCTTAPVIELRHFRDAIAAGML